MCGNEAPDAAKGAECAQLDAIAKHLDSHPELKFVWFDFWCMPQHSLLDRRNILWTPRNILWAPMNILWTYATAPAEGEEGKRKRECRRTRLEDAC